jgi:hypothetical protein
MMSHRHDASYEAYNTTLIKNGSKSNKVSTFRAKIVQSIHLLKADQKVIAHTRLATFLGMEQCDIDSVVCCIIQLKLECLPFKPILIAVREALAIQMTVNDDDAYFLLKVLRALYGWEVCDGLGSGEASGTATCVVASTAHVTALAPAPAVPAATSSSCMRPQYKRDVSDLPAGCFKLPDYSIPDGWAAYELFAWEAGDEQERPANMNGRPDPQLSRVWLWRVSTCPVTELKIFRSVSGSNWSDSCYSSHYIAQFDHIKEPTRSEKKSLIVREAKHAFEQLRGTIGSEHRSVASSHKGMEIGKIDPNGGSEASNLEWKPPGTAHLGNKYGVLGKRKYGDVLGLKDMGTVFSPVEYRVSGITHEGVGFTTVKIRNGREVSKGTLAHGRLWVSNAGVFFYDTTDKWYREPCSTAAVVQLLARDVCDSESDENMFSGAAYKSRQYQSFSWNGISNAAVHRAVALTFLGPPPNNDYTNYTVDHIDHTRKQYNYVHVKLHDQAQGNAMHNEERSNLRWADKATQANNRSTCRPTKARVDHDEPDHHGDEAAEAVAHTIRTDDERLSALDRQPDGVRVRLRRLKGRYADAVLYFLSISHRIQEPLSCEPTRDACPVVPLIYNLVVKGLQVLRLEDVPMRVWELAIGERRLEEAKRWTPDAIREFVMHMPNTQGTTQLLRAYFMMRAFYFHADQSRCLVARASGA